MENYEEAQGRLRMDGDELMGFMQDMAGNCIGALDPLMLMYKKGLHGELQALRMMGIKEFDLYSLWNDISNRDLRMMLKQMWVLASGVYSQEEIDQNFKTNNATKYGLDERVKSIDENGFANPIPFCFNSIDVNKYCELPQTARINDKDFIKYAAANRVMHRLMRFCGRARFPFNNLEVGDYDATIGTGEDKLVMSQKQLNEMVDFLPSKFFDRLGKNDYPKFKEWLKHTRKNFLPALPVIRRFPIDKIQDYFNNNNCVRFGKLKDEYGINDYEGLEGLLSISYILGLFDNSGEQSGKAANYIKTHFMDKGVEGMQLHKLYGAIELKCNKQFADFFMIHYAKDPSSFKNENGVDMTGEILENFDRILQFRTEKEIKTNTRNKQLTPKDAMAVFMEPSFAYNETDEKYNPLAETLIKYATSREEFQWSKGLYDKALEIKEEDVQVPMVCDTTESPVTFRTLSKADPFNFVVGKKSNCCFRYNGVAQVSWLYCIRSTDSRIVTFTTPNDSFFQGWVWYDKETKTLCIDNLEGGLCHKDGDRYNEGIRKDFISAVIRYADTTFAEMKNMGIPCDKINLGKNLPFYEDFIEAEKDGEILTDNDPSQYTIINRLYTDAGAQYTITNAELFEVRHPKEQKLAKATVGNDDARCLPNIIQ